MSRASESKGGRLVTGAAFFVLLAFVVAAASAASNSNFNQEDQAALERTTAVVTAIDERMSTYAEVLYGVRGSFDQEEPSDRVEFHQLIERLSVERRYPGVQVMGAAHLIERSEIPTYEKLVGTGAAWSGYAYPEFEVFPSTSSAFVLPIDFIEPQRGNERAFGLDFLSEEIRRTAALSARDSGEASATAPVTLVQETETQLAFLVMVPIYKHRKAIATQAQRRDAFEGIVYAAFRMGDLIEGVLGEDSPRDVRVVDVASNQLMFDSMGAGLPDVSDGPHVGTVLVGGRDWSVYVDDEAALLSPIERSVPVAILGIGAMLAALFAALVRSMRGARSRAVTLAREMTGELAALSEAAAEGIVTVDVDGTIVAWNRGASEIFGGGTDDYLGRSVADLVPKSQHGAASTELNRLMTEESESLSRKTFSSTGTRLDGSTFPAEFSVSRWTARGEWFLTGFIRDVTVQREASRQIRETSDTLLAVLGAVTEMAVIGTDSNGLFTFFNVGAERLTGYSSDEVVGHATPALLHDLGETQERAAELGIEPGFEVFVQSARSGIPETLPWTYWRKDGTSVPVDLTVTPIYEHNGELRGFIGVAMDIADRVATEQAQQDALEHERDALAQLTALDKARSDFVSTTSHELRTPLTSILGYAELLDDVFEASGDDRERNLVGAIERNAERLSVMVEDLLVYSQIESGSLRLRKGPCDVAKMLRSVVETVTPVAMNAEVTLMLDAGEVGSISGDAVQLERVLLNVINNALKFSSPGGEVRVEASLDHNDVNIVVVDQGIGIPEADQSQVFDRFFRSNAAEELAIQGTGLGLPIALSIVERHGGQLLLSSVEGVGTTVTIGLPIVAPAPADAPMPVA